MGDGALWGGLWIDVALFAIAAGAVAFAGVRMASVADRLADVTGLGEAVTGAVLLGASTSLAGIVTSVTAAANGHAELAVSNAVGGIAAQTVFIALADFAYRKANLEHAAASATNLISGVALIALLSMPLLAAAAPAVSWFGIHPCTPLLVAAYAFSLRLARRMQDKPMWGPTRTPETAVDTPEEAPAGRREVLRLAAHFAGLAVVVALAGYAIAKSGIAIAAASGMGEGIVGAFFTAVATSLPELVTTIAAVRRGALTLAVGGIIGGNTFDVLFIAFADAAYRPGSIYHAMSGQQHFTIVLAILMTAVLLLGLLGREKHGVANVGFESLSIIALYGFGIVILASV